MPNLGGSKNTYPRFLREVILAVPGWGSVAKPRLERCQSPGLLTDPKGTSAWKARCGQWNRIRPHGAHRLGASAQDWSLLGTSEVQGDSAFAPPLGPGEASLATDTQPSTVERGSRRGLPACVQSVVWLQCFAGRPSPSSTRGIERALHADVAGRRLTRVSDAEFAP